MCDVEPSWAPAHELGNDIAVPSAGKMAASITSVTFFSGKKGDMTLTIELPFIFQVVKCVTICAANSYWLFLPSA